MEQTKTLGIHRWRLVRYCEMRCLVAGLYLIGQILLLLGFGKSFNSWAFSLKYRLGRDALSIYSCFTLWGFVLYQQDKRIPIMKITDVKLVQGPILNSMGLWNMHIQTAGTGTYRPEAILYALELPEQVRDDILDAIKNIHAANRDEIVSD